MLSKSESLRLKGSAILIMVFLHLFNRTENVKGCSISINFLGEPLVSQLAKFVEICVPLYLFLSGYGLFLLFRKNNGISPLKRILKLYFIFWSCFILFIPLGCILVPDMYPGSLLAFFENLIAYKTSYNWEWWFVFPFVLLLLSSNVILKFVYKNSIITILVVSSIIYFFSYLIISLYKPLLLEYHILFNLFEYMRMICSFMWGALFAKYDLFLKIKDIIRLNTCWTNVLMFSILFVAFTIRSILPIHAASVLFMIVFVCCFSQINMNSRLEKFFVLLGEHSTNIWLVHTFFCYYFFHDFIYGLRYPVLIYIVTLLLSFISSLLINKIHHLLFGKINNLIR